MRHPADNVLISRLAVVLLMGVVWGLYYINARLAYRFFTGRRVLQLLTVAGSVAIGWLQELIMERLSPEDAHGRHFGVFIVAECGGAMLVLFWTLIRERAKARSAPVGRN